MDSFKILIKIYKYILNLYRIRSEQYDHILERPEPCPEDTRLAILIYFSQSQQYLKSIYKLKLKLILNGIKLCFSVFCIRSTHETDLQCV